MNRFRKIVHGSEIHPLILQQLPAETLAYITKLYKMCVLLGYTPTIWKECKIVFIPKPGKGSCQTAKAWRPILLTNYLLKALEKLCLRKKSRRLIEAITGQNNLHYVQNKIAKAEHLCRLCEEEEGTFDHLVNHCPCLRQAKQDHFGLNKIEKSWTIHKGNIRILKNQGNRLSSKRGGQQ